MNEFVLDSPSPDCTFLLAEQTGKLLEPGDVLALRGELGAGKTLYARGVACGLGIPANVPVTSPTFTIINEYAGRLYLYHIDLYRLTGPDDLETLPWQEALFGNGACVIEWPERLGKFLPTERWEIRFRVTGEESRRIAISARGKKNRSRAEKWWEHFESARAASECR